MKKLLFLILFASLCFADVTLNSPVPLSVSDIKQSDFQEHVNYLEDTYLGKIAPGQTLDLTFSRKADENFNWNKIEFLTSDFEPSVALTETTLIARLKFPLETTEGLHEFTIKFTNDLNLRSPEIVTFKVEVSKNLYIFLVPADIKVVAGEPEEVPLEIRSESISTDELILGDFENFPAAWSNSGTIQMGPGETEKVNFKIEALDEGLYNLKFQLSSTSGAVLGQKDISLRVYPTLNSKFRIYSEGFAFVPTILQPFYSVLSWFKLLF